MWKHQRYFFSSDVIKLTTDKIAKNIISFKILPRILWISWNAEGTRKKNENENIIVIFCFEHPTIKM